MKNKPLQGVSLLLVEDAADIALSLSEVFRYAGAAKVEIKASARQARKRLVVDPAPDMVLLDQHIAGGETGVQLALWMREQPGLHQTLRISYSGSDPDELRNQCPDNQVFHAIITKPIPIPHLVEALTNLLSTDTDAHDTDAQSP
ncbi:MAG: response regulator [Chloroflexaceae bacterium]|nr:response regulator [Chloroflexaceae bacterium]